MIILFVFDIYSYSSNKNGQGGYKNQQCWDCGEEGHKSYECPNKVRAGPSKPKGPGGPPPPPPPPPGTTGGTTTVA